MVTPLQGSERALIRPKLLLGVVIALSAATPIVNAHPTEREALEAREERRLCQTELPWTERGDPVQLGMSADTVRAATRDLGGVSDTEGKLDPAGRDRALSLGRLSRTADGDPLAIVEYSVWNGHVYRIRWKLGKAFERPILSEFKRVATTCLGVARSDQTIEAEPGSSAPTLRRIRWIHGDRSIELLQLYPLRGGPVYLSVTLQDRLREIGVAGGIPSSDPLPDSPWWRRSMAQIDPVSPAERKALGKRFLGVLSHLDH